MLKEINSAKTNRGEINFNKTTSKRGFDKLLFKDYYNNGCSLQISSLASDECVWLGIENAQPRILTRDAIRLGLLKEAEAPHNCYGEPCGWVEYPVPEEVSFTTRMHLSRKQILKLALKLLEFAFCGKIISEKD